MLRDHGSQWPLEPWPVALELKEARPDRLQSSGTSRRPQRRLDDRERRLVKGGRHEQGVSPVLRKLDQLLADDLPEAGRGRKRFSRPPTDLAAYQSAVSANPYYWSNHNTLGGAYFEFGNTEKAQAMKSILQEGEGK